MTRRRATAVMLLVLAWCAVAPCLALDCAPASGAVLAASEQVDHAPALVSRAAAADPVARLTRDDLGASLPADQQLQRALLAAAAAHDRPALAPTGVHRRRALARRGSRAPDEPF